MRADVHVRRFRNAETAECLQSNRTTNPSPVSAVTRNTDTNIEHKTTAKDKAQSKACAMGRGAHIERYSHARQPLPCNPRACPAHVRSRLVPNHCWPLTVALASRVPRCSTLAQWRAPQPCDNRSAGVICAHAPRPAPAARARLPFLRAKGWMAGGEAGRARVRQRCCAAADVAAVPHSLDLLPSHAPLCDTLCSLTRPVYLRT